MKTPYFAIMLAATILSRHIVAQEETPTPSLATDSRIETPKVSKTPAPTTSQTDLKKKPRPVYESGQPKFQHLTTPTPFRPRPDTTYNPTPWPLKKKPTPPPPHSDTTVRQPTTDLKKKPTHLFRPPPDTTLKPTPSPFRPPPDTRLRVTPTPTPVSPYNPFGRDPITTGWKNGAHTFENGVRAEIVGNDMVITDARGRRSVTHKHELNHQPPGAALPRGCGALLHWILTHDPGTYKGRYAFALYVMHCG